MVLCEALCLGKPIISTRVTGAEEILLGGVGVLCDRDEQMLANALIALYENSDELSKMGNRALIASKKVSFEAYVNRFINILLK